MKTKVRNNNEIMRKGGVHGKSRKAVRLADKQKLREEAKCIDSANNHKQS